MVRGRRFSSSATAALDSVFYLGSGRGLPLHVAPPQARALTWSLTLTRLNSGRDLSSQWCLKNCTARSRAWAFSREEKVPRLRRLPVFGSLLREYKRYSPDFNLRIISTSSGHDKSAGHDKSGTRRVPKLPAVRYARASVPLGSGDATDPLVDKTTTRNAGTATPPSAWRSPASPMLLGHQWQRRRFSLPPSA